MSEIRAASTYSFKHSHQITSAPATPVESHRDLLTSISWSIAIAALCYFLCGAIFVGSKGYGADNDTYGMLATWRFIKETGTYFPSRFQGNLVPELIIGLCAQIGSYVLANAMSLILGVASLALLYAMIARVRSANVALLAVAAIAANPFFLIASCTSIDYIYAIFFFIAGLYVLATYDLLPIAALLFALSCSSRITYFVPALGALLWATWRNPRDRRSPGLQSLALFVAMSALLYFPAWVSARGSFAFLGAAHPWNMGIAGTVARFTYKTIGLDGIFGSLVLGLMMAAIAYGWQRDREALTSDREALIRDREALIRWMLSGLIIYQLALFAWLPVENSYLLPALGAFIVLGAISIRPRTFMLLAMALIATNAAYGFISLEPLRISYRSRYGYDGCVSTIPLGAKVSPHLEGGVITDYLEEEKINRRCNDLIAWQWVNGEVVRLPKREFGP
jgi:hypothetical protein